MKHEVEIAGQKLQVEIEQSKDMINAIVDGTVYQISLIKPDKGIYSLLINNQIYEFYLEPGLSQESFTVQFGKQRLAATIIDRKRSAPKQERSTVGAQAIRAPMPGRIVQIVKVVGDKVNAGEGVLIIEAMKMQNELTAPKAGTITELKVISGQTVAANEVIAVIE